MLTMLRRTCAALFVLILAVALPACRKRETVSANASTVEIDRSGKNVTIRTAQATGTAGLPSAAFPAGFPKDIPMYPGAHVAATLEAGGTAAARVATIETADWPDAVAKFYQGKLARWETAMDMKTEDAHMLILRSPGGRRSLTLSATREAMKTVVTLTVSGS